MITDSQLDEAEHRAKAATPGPWVWRSMDGLCNKYVDNGVVIGKNEDGSLIYPSVENGLYVATMDPTFTPQLSEE